MQHPNRSVSASFIILAALTTGLALPAQTYLHLPASLTPATSELPNYSLRPLMQSSCRVQMFFDATEVGSSSFTMDELSLRYDGPVPQVGSPGPFPIQRFVIKVGTSTVAIPGARFDANVQAPLTTVFDAPWSYLPDPGSMTPTPWGAPGTSLTWAFTAPFAVTIPQGGWLVIEMLMENNGQTSFSHALLDGARATGVVVNGSASNSGMGCGVGTGPAATISTTGVYAPGSAHFLAGQNLGSGALVFALIGLSNTVSPFGPLPVQLPGTGCYFYNSFDTYWFMTADSSGTIAPNSQTGALVLAANPVFSGMTLYEQLMSYAPGANPPWDFALSDLRTVALGSLNPPPIGTWAVSHGSSHTAAVADLVEPFGYAVRLKLR